MINFLNVLIDLSASLIIFKIILEMSELFLTSSVSQTMLHVLNDVWGLNDDDDVK